MVTRDYRDCHQSADAASQYEVLYGPGTYDDWVWNFEKACIARAVRRHAADRHPNIRLLDFACGTGRILAFLEPMTAEATGVDVSSAMLAVAAERVGKAKLVCADMTRQDIFPSARFDLVTAFRFFLNAGPALRRDALTAIRRVLTEDGIMITNIHRNLVSSRLMGYVFRRYVQRQGLNAMSLWEMKRLLAGHGFEVIDVAGVGWVSPQMYRLLGRRWCDRIERLVMRIPLLPHLAGNLIVVCRKVDRR
jgi:ubiquinone/menaquinone biosynthesis C-methylase UbiE